MATDKPIWFPLYVQDWLGSTQIMCMTPEQEGGYLRLLICQWVSDSCDLPDDDATLATLSRLGKRWVKVGGVIRRCFEPVAASPGRIRNERLYAERIAYMEAIAKKRVAGQKGAKSKWQTDGTAIAVPLAVPEQTDGGAMAVPEECHGDAMQVPMAQGMAKHGQSQSQVQVPPPKGGGRWQCHGDAIAVPEQTDGGAMQNRPTMADSVAYFAKVGSDYQPEEIKAVWLSFEATAVDGQWFIGRRTVGDWRAAMEARLADRKIERDKRKDNNDQARKRSVAEDRNAFIQGDPEERQRRLLARVARDQEKVRAMSRDAVAKEVAGPGSA